MNTIYFSYIYVPAVKENKFLSLVKYIETALGLLGVRSNLNAKI